MVNIQATLEAELHTSGSSPPELPAACRLCAKVAAHLDSESPFDDDDDEWDPTLFPIPRYVPKPTEIPCPPALPRRLAVTDELVSVVCPTTAARHWAHPLLYRSFAQQTHRRKELIVLDTGGQPSPFFSQLDDPRVSYHHIAPAPAHWHGSIWEWEPGLATCTTQQIDQALHGLAPLDRRAKRAPRI